MIKKLIALLSAAALLFLCSCGKAEKAAAVLDISGAEISGELFAFYLDKVASVPEKYGLGENASPQELCRAAEDRCARHVAVSTLFSQYGLRLTNAQKIETAEKVNDLWVCFGEHYKKAGISREAVAAAAENAVFEEAIISHLFGSSDSEAFENAVKAYFAQNYISFRTVCGFFVTADASGADIEMTKAQKDELIKNYQAKAGELTCAGDIEKAAEALGAAASSPVLLKKGQSGYPEGFFEKVAAQKNESAAVIPFEDCVFLVWRSDAAGMEEQYAEHRSECVKELCADAAQSVFSEEISRLTVHRNEEEINRFAEKADIYG